MARKRQTSVQDKSVLVIGLGRFGQAIATSIDRLGLDVLAVEKDPKMVAQCSGRLPVVQADAANPEALEQLGARDFQVAVVGIGSALEASVLVTGNLVDLGIPQIWAKAITREHGRILERIGADHVVFPEHDAGARVAHLVSGKMLDYIEFADDFAIVKMRTPSEMIGKTLAESDVLGRYGVTIIGVKAFGKEFQYARPEIQVVADDRIVCGGHSEALDAFAALP
ncbi:MAG: TrkA family potassium uptake protein [Promicromonosporaceae bacterium]|nr:TrkA family potassium uptake protein [Promicromonosporaceae bacterium]